MSRTDVRPITVLHFPSPTASQLNPFIQLLVDELKGSVTVKEFTWREAILGRYDLIHWHWPDYLGAANSRRGRLVKLLATTVLALRVRFGRTPVVATRHNLEPRSHHGSPIEDLSLRIAQHVETNHVFLSTPAVLEPGDRVIKHCYYPAAWTSAPSRERDGRTIGYFGTVLPYKGVPQLVRAFGEAPGADLQLVVAGAPKDRDVTSQVEDLAAADERVVLDLRVLPEAELDALIRRCAVVVLPYTQMYNSGAALLALSHRTPILVPESESMVELQRDAGDAWVITYAGDLTGDTLDRALTVARSTIGSEPHLEDRSPSRMAAEYVRLYREVLDD